MKNQIDILRKQIDEIDGQIVNLLAKRMKTVKNIGLLKKKLNIRPLDLVRWQKITKTKKGYVKKIWEVIHKEALKIEQTL